MATNTKETWANFLKDYIFSGMDDTGLTSNTREIMYYLYGDDGTHNTPTPEEKGSAGEKSSGRWKLSLPEFPHFKEAPREWTREEKRAALIYAMKDSLKMPTISFAMTYCPTLKVDPKGGILFTLEANTILGRTDIDWALTLVALGLGIIAPDVVYAVGKPVWNKIRGKDVKFEYNNPAELAAKIMAEQMTNLTMKFHDFFPDLLSDAKNSDYTSLHYRALCDVYGKP